MLLLGTVSEIRTHTPVGCKHLKFAGLPVPLHDGILIWRCVPDSNRSISSVTGRQPLLAVSRTILIWYRRSESNRHCPFGRWNLNPEGLPIPPLRHINYATLFGGNGRIRTDAHFFMREAIYQLIVHYHETLHFTTFVLREVELNQPDRRLASAVSLNIW